MTDEDDLETDTDDDDDRQVKIKTPRIICPLSDEHFDELQRTLSGIDINFHNVTRVYEAVRNLVKSRCNVNHDTFSD